MSSDRLVDFQCPACGKRLKVASAYAGRRVKCPKCQQVSTVPGERTAGQTAPPAPTSPPVPSSPPAATSPPAIPLTNVRVANPDDDWLNLGAPAIADVSDRQQAVEANKLAKEQERISKQNRERQRQASHRPPAAAPTAARDGQLAAGSRPLTGSAPSSPPTSSLDDDLPQLAAEEPESQRSARVEATPKRSIFDDDLPELSELQGAPSSASRAHKSQADKLLAAHADVDPNPEYRVECTACGTAQYVRLSQKGQKIKCPDCYLQFRVPPPPATKKKATIQLSGEDIPLSAAEELQHAQTLQSQRLRAAQLLEKAQQQASDDDLDGLYDGDFDTAGFIERTFGFFKDPVAVAHVIGYGIVFAGLFAAGQFAANVSESRFGGGVVLLVAIGAPVLGLLFGMPMLSGAMALLEAVANRQKRVSEWPGFNLFDNAGDIAAITGALLAALIPGFLIGSWLGGDEIGAGRIKITGMMVTSFALFPVFLLSMLDNGSVFAPISSSVVRSFREAAEAWGGYYLKTLIAFSGTMVLWLVLLGKHEILAAVAGSLLPLLVFFTCQQMGALADSIGEHLSFEWEPPTQEADETSRDGQGRQQQAVHVGQSLRD